MNFVRIGKNLVNLDHVCLVADNTGDANPHAVAALASGGAVEFVGQDAADLVAAVEPKPEAQAGLKELSADKKAK